MARTVKGQDAKSMENARNRQRARFWKIEQERLREEYRKRKFDGGIPGDVKQGDIRS